MPYFHASPTGGITQLEPRVSNHGTPLVYVSAKRAHVLPYLSNAVEKFCRETAFPHTGPFYKWASYGFDQKGRLFLDEYWPDALRDTYAGVSGYIYTVKVADALQPMSDIPDAFCAAQPLAVCKCEYIPDALEAILAAEAAGDLAIRRFAAQSEGTLRWLAKCIPQEWESHAAHPEYRAFLQAKFPQLLR